MWTQAHRGSSKQSGTALPSDLSDAQWERLEALIPAAKAGGRPRKTDMRAAMNAIFYLLLLRTGCLAVAERDAEFLEVAIGEIGEHVEIDLVVSEIGLVLAKADRVQPLGDVHRRSTHGSTPMMVPGRLRVQVGTVGRPLWGRFDPFATPPVNGRYLREGDGRS